jgi:protocatechuate 3,4-dioxygenase beta subunit
MKYLLASVLILLLPAAASTLSAQSTAPPKAQLSNTGVISGQVTLKAKPAPHVTMVMQGAADSAVQLSKAELKTSTDANGVYRLTGLPAGSYWVKPMTPAFVEVSRKVTIGDGETANGIDFELVKGGVITGKITDVDGHPLIEEMVYLWDAEPASNQTAEKIGYVRLHVQTDDRGIYRIFGVTAGRYKVAVGNDGGNLLWRSEARRYRRVFFPGVTDPGKATVIEVSEGSETSHVDITVDGPIHTFAASGVVLDEQTNKPAPNMQCWITEQRKEFIPLEVISNSQGQFQIDGLLPGDYQVRAEPEQGDNVRSNPVSFQIVDRDIEGLVIKTAKGAGIAGVVVLENNKDPVVMDKLRQLSVGTWNLTAADSQYVWHSSPINPDYSFSIKGLNAGSLLLDIDHGQAGFSLARIEYPKGTPTDRIPVNADQQITGVRVIVRYGTASIEGTVKIVNGKLPGDSRLYVSAREITAPDQRSPVEVDDRGHFTIGNLAAGTYFVTPNLSTPGAMNPVGPPQQVVVSDGATVNVTLTVDFGKGSEAGGPIGRSLSMRSGLLASPSRLSDALAALFPYL